MKRMAPRLLACLLLSSFLLGCGNSADKNINSGMDKPVPARKESTPSDAKKK